MKSWGDLLTEFDALLNDSERKSYAEDLRKNAWQRACENFAISHTAPFRTATASAASYADGTLVTLPQDFLELPTGGVQAVGDGWLEPITVEPGGSIPNDGYLMMADGIYLPGGYTNVRLWYYAHYPSVVDAATTFGLPTWAEWAVMNLAMAYMLYPSMMDQQLLRQYQDKSMAGRPEDNPPRKQALFLMTIYSDLIRTVSPQNRGMIYTPGTKV
jgi:hypothetical protein